MTGCFKCTRSGKNTWLTIESVKGVFNCAWLIPDVSDTDVPLIHTVLNQWSRIININLILKVQCLSFILAWFERAADTSPGPAVLKVYTLTEVRSFHRYLVWVCRASGAGYWFAVTHRAGCCGLYMLPLVLRKLFVFFFHGIVLDRWSSEALLREITPWPLSIPR